MNLLLSSPDTKSAKFKEMRDIKTDRRATMGIRQSALFRAAAYRDETEAR